MFEFKSSFTVLGVPNLRKKKSLAGLPQCSSQLAAPSHHLRLWRTHPFQQEQEISILKCHAFSRCLAIVWQIPMSCLQRSGCYFKLEKRHLFPLVEQRQSAPKLAELQRHNTIGRTTEIWDRLLIFNWQQHIQFKQWSGVFHLLTENNLPF